VSKFIAHVANESPPQATVSDLLLVPIWLALGFLGCFWLGPLCVDAMRPDPDRVNDFFQDWGSARNFLTGMPVYTHHAISIPQHLNVPFDAVTGVEYNAHPPSSVLLALPFAHLDYPDAVLAWNTLSLLAFVASLATVAVVLPVPRALLLPSLALLTFCHPLYGNLYRGQLTFILVLLVTVIWALERSDRPAMAGLVLGAAASIKLFPAYLALYYAARCQVRPLLTAVLAFLALTAITATLLGLDAYYDYIQVVLPAQTRFRSLGYNYAIAGLWYRLFDPVGERGWMTPLWPSPALAGYGTLFSDLLLTAVLAMFVHRARTQAQRDLALASTITAMLLASPVTWDTSLPLLLVPFAVVAHNSGWLRWMPAALIVILVIIWTPQQAITQLALGSRSVRIASWTFMLGAPSVKFYALLGLFALGLIAFQAEQEAEKHGIGPRATLQ
jgi:Glycosyltransferase family 87